jgi:2-oxoglutarate dehydrogenase E2 component (dihydrolipoamide succinyltransferase)
MALVELIMPKMGESIMEATVLSWLKKPGDKIEEDESVLEVATDKVDTEVPSTHAGILKELLAKDGDVVKVGAPIAVISIEGEVSVSNTKEETASKEEEKTEEVTEEPVALGSNGSSVHHDFSTANRFYSPLVKNIAKEENISIAELETIPGTGQEGRVTKKDILSFVQTRKSGTAPARMLSTPVVSASPLVPASISGADEIIEMDRMRRMIAERMVDSKRIAPHVTSFVEADVTNVVTWRNRNKKAFQIKYGDSLTFTPIFIEAVVKAIKDYPMINVQVDGTRIIKKANINIGMAVALPTGNLIVPVIKDADQYTITGLARMVNDLAKRARENKLKPDELSGGTFTISNVGSFGNVMGTPIIMQPQVAILALGAIQKKPAVIETAQGDAIAIRHKMFLSHSYDHRVVDGSLGGMFVKRVSDYLEGFDLNKIA